MSLSNPDSAGTWNSKHRRVESAIRRLGISREEAAELQGYIKRLLDEDKAVYEGYPIESLLIHRYQTDWKHLRIWKEEPVVSVEPAFKRCVEAVRDGLNLSRFPISICPVSSQSSAPIRSSPTARQAGSGYSSWGESTSTTRSNQPSFPRLSPESPLYIRPHTRATSSNRAWESAPASKASPLESPSFCGGSDPGPSARSRKYPPIVERQYSLPLAYLRPRSSSSSRATSPFLPSGFPLPPYSPTTPYQPNRTSQNFFPLNHPNISDPPRDFTFTERIKRESYRTRSWCPKPHPIPCSTPSLIQPTTNPYNNSLTPTMDTITPTTTPRQRIPTRKPVPIPTPSSSNDIIPASLNPPHTRTRRMSSPAVQTHNHHSSHDPDNYPNHFSQPGVTSHSSPLLPHPPNRPTTLPDLPINKSSQPPHHHPRDAFRDDDDDLYPGKKRDLTPDFAIVPVTKLSPHSSHSSHSHSSPDRRRRHQQSHHNRRARAKSRSGMDDDERGRRRKVVESEREGEQRERGSWRRLVCGCCGDER